MPGLVGKSPTIVKICEYPILEKLRISNLEESVSIIREDIFHEHKIDPLLSISLTVYIGPGAPRQPLHRDDNINGVRHAREFDPKKAGQFGCLIAGSRTTRQNGATMVAPSPYKWDDKRTLRPDEVCFAGEYALVLVPMSEIRVLNCPMMVFSHCSLTFGARDGHRLCRESACDLPSILLSWRRS